MNLLASLVALLFYAAASMFGVPNIENLGLRQFPLARVREVLEARSDPDGTLRATYLPLMAIALPECGADLLDLERTHCAEFPAGGFALPVEFGGPVQHPAAERIDTPVEAFTTDKKSPEASSLSFYLSQRALRVEHIEQPLGWAAGAAPIAHLT